MDRTRTLIRATIVASLAFASWYPAAQAASVPTLSAQQIIDKNIAARGGLAAWRAVKTMSVSGQMDVGGKKATQLPFVMEMKRNRKSRVEVQFNGQTAVQVFDGEHGWLVRPYLGRTDAEPYSPTQQERAAEWQDLDGPLIDHEAKGIKVELEGIEAVEGHDAYKLKLTLMNGSVRHDWIDSHSFLEVKLQGLPRVMDGRPRSVDTYYRDYRSVNGLMVAYVLETAVQGVAGTHKMTIDKVNVNPALDDGLFAKPAVLAAGAKG
jgi:hypothetical protein